MIALYCQSTESTSSFKSTTFAGTANTDFIICNGTTGFDYSYYITVPANTPYIIHHKKVNKPSVWFDRYRTCRKSVAFKIKFMIFKPQTRRSKIQINKQKRKTYLQK